MRKALMVDLICSFFIFLFLYTALSKLFDYPSFRHVLQQSPLLGSIAPVIAWGLPVTEIGISMLLILPNTRLAGLYATLLTLFVFTSYLSYMIAVAPRLPCSCGGVLKQLSWRQHLLFNTGCIGLSILGILFHHSMMKARTIQPGHPFRPIRKS